MITHGVDEISNNRILQQALNKKDPEIEAWIEEKGLTQGCCIMKEIPVQGESQV